MAIVRQDQMSLHELRELCGRQGLTSKVLGMQNESLGMAELEALKLVARFREDQGVEVSNLTGICYHGWERGRIKLPSLD
jgi:hypothetical protein